MLPTRKVGGGAVIGLPAATITIWLATTSGLIPTPPSEVAAAWGVICTFAASYMIPDPKPGATTSDRS
jgi:hypothetical protein